MIGSLVAEAAARCRAEPDDLCAAIRMALPADRCPVLPIEGVYVGRVLPRQMACLLRVQPVRTCFRYNCRVAVLAAIYPEPERATQLAVPPLGSAVRLPGLARTRPRWL